MKVKKIKQYKKHDLISIRKQALAAARHYQELGPRPVYVFPCKRTGQSVQFRQILAQKLSESGHSSRRINELSCAKIGYPFIEVNLEDYE